VECELEKCDDDEDGANDEVTVAMTPTLEVRLQARSIQTQTQTLPPPMKEKRQGTGTPTKGIGFAFPLPPHFACGEWLKEGVGGVGIPPYKRNYQSRRIHSSCQAVSQGECHDGFSLVCFCGVFS